MYLDSQTFDFADQHQRKPDKFLKKVLYCHMWSESEESKFSMIGIDGKVYMDEWINTSIKTYCATL